MRITWRVKEIFVLFSWYASFFKSQSTFNTASFFHADLRIDHLLFGSMKFSILVTDLISFK